MTALTKIIKAQKSRYESSLDRKTRFHGNQSTLTEPEPTHGHRQHLSSEKALKAQVSKFKKSELPVTMGCAGSTQVNESKTGKKLRVMSATERTFNAAILIQKWYRRYLAREEVRRRCSWTIFTTLEYAGEQDQTKEEIKKTLYNFFTDLLVHILKVKNKNRLVGAIALPSPYGPAGKSLLELEEEGEDDELQKKTNPRTIKVEPEYRGIKIRHPMNAQTVLTLIEYYKHRKTLHAKYVLSVIHEARNILKYKPNISYASTVHSKQITVCGDLHGKLEDLLTVFYKNGLPSHDNPYVFNGDFVDRGNQSMEVLMILLACLVVWPDAVFLNRGNHEDFMMNVRYGFLKEIMLKYKDKYGWKVNPSNVITVFSASNYYDTGSNRGAYIKLIGDELIVHPVLYVSSKLARHATLRQRQGILEQSALRELKRHIASKRFVLMQEFNKRNKAMVSTISLNDWCEAMEAAVGLGLPWRLLCPKLAVYDPEKQLVEYSTTLEDYHTYTEGLIEDGHTLLEALYQNKEILEAVFNMIDRDGHARSKLDRHPGSISMDEFVDTCSFLGDQLGKPIPPGTIQDLAHSIDMNKDGFIDLNEFLEAFRLVNGNRPLPSEAPPEEVPDNNSDGTSAGNGSFQVVEGEAASQAPETKSIEEDLDVDDNCSLRLY
ncbi:Serine/threonine-protein phosphatase with like protein [Argiope bruennichi]|uniref:Serine/threonine-protein phosphatase n=1 Tax=Argiope bruennichi TaxID=94029 RepID=A0A8T0F4P9_ARGBR|nr:Serine/threonine-protein phosphatase with like protein [Argiope bruennichi]